MASVFDVAKYILMKTGKMTTMKLQKLLYYSQAWSLVWDEQPLFDNVIQAWANGPVAPSVYNYHRGLYFVDSDKFPMADPSNLTDTQRETVDAVLAYYGDKPAQWLIDLTHSEKPWQDARKGLGPGERGNNDISHASMADYYSGL